MRLLTVYRLPLPLFLKLFIFLAYNPREGRLLTHNTAPAGFTEFEMGGAFARSRGHVLFNEDFYQKTFA
jgi:hypothetical protein